MPDFIPLDWLTPQQNANIELLADTLGNMTRLKEIAHAAGLSAFDMAQYEGAAYHDCGTAACALGFAPSILGIPREIGQAWESYSQKHLGVPWPATDIDNPDYGDRAELMRDTYRWLFGGGWSTTDNTPEGAAYRLNLALTHGIPADVHQRIWSDLQGAYGGLPDADIAIAQAKPATFHEAQVILTES